MAIQKKPGEDTFLRKEIVAGISNCAAFGKVSICSSDIFSQFLEYQGRTCLSGSQNLVWVKIVLLTFILNVIETADGPDNLEKKVKSWLGSNIVNYFFERLLTKFD